MPETARYLTVDDVYQIVIPAIHQAAYSLMIFYAVWKAAVWLLSYVIERFLSARYGA